MFTGITSGIGKIKKISGSNTLKHLTISMPEGFLSGVQRGASLAVDGVCLTVVDFNSNEAVFDVISETLSRTTLEFLQEGNLVNLERSARFGDEIGGHVLSGHVFGTVKIESIQQSENRYVISFKCPLEWIKYLFPKGFVALNGSSLTLVDVDKTEGIFTVHLIPETLEKSTFKIKKINDLVNLEIEMQTQTIVDTLEKIYTSKSLSR